MRVYAVVSVGAALISTASTLAIRAGAAAFNATLFDRVKSASDLFAWELVGTTSEKSQLGQLCSEAAGYASRLELAGLDGQEVTDIICLEAISFLAPDVEFVTKFLGQTSAYLFSDYLIGSFDGTSVNTVNGNMNPLVWLCQYGLSYSSIERYGLDPTSVFTYICQAGDVAVRSRIQDEPGISNPASVTAYYDSLSELFGYQLASTATDATGITSLCSSFQNGTDNAQLAAYRLNTSIIADTVCQFNAPVDPVIALDGPIEANTKAFLNVLLNADANADIAVWKDWLCSTLSFDAMQAIGLDGSEVIGTVCSG